MLQRGTPYHQRDLRAAVFKSAITLFCALNVIPRDLQAMLFKNTRFDGERPRGIAGAIAASSFQMSIHNSETHQAHRDYLLPVETILLDTHLVEYLERILGSIIMATTDGSSRHVKVHQ